MPVGIWRTAALHSCCYEVCATHVAPRSLPKGCEFGKQILQQWLGSYAQQGFLQAGLTSLWPPNVSNMKPQEQLWTQRSSQHRVSAVTAARCWGEMVGHQQAQGQLCQAVDPIVTRLFKSYVRSRTWPAEDSCEVP